MTTTTVNYTDPDQMLDAKDDPIPGERFMLPYGGKIPTRFMVQYRNKVWRRVPDQVVQVVDYVGHHAFSVIVTTTDATPEPQEVWLCVDCAYDQRYKLGEYTAIGDCDECGDCGHDTVLNFSDRGCHNCHTDVAGMRIRMAYWGA